MQLLLCLLGNLLLWREFICLFLGYLDFPFPVLVFVIHWPVLRMVAVGTYHLVPDVGYCAHQAETNFRKPLEELFVCTFQITFRNLQVVYFGRSVYRTLPAVVWYID